jgi:hypothetical protein
VIYLYLDRLQSWPSGDAQYPKREFEHAYLVPAQ